MSFYEQEKTLATSVADSLDTEPIEEGEAYEAEAEERSVRDLSTVELGREGERIAQNYLQRRGYKILEKNWTFGGFEADIIAFEDDTVVLVEVKTRLALGELSMEMPELAVDKQKRLKYRTLGFGYLALHPQVDSMRFDVIALNIVGEHNAKLRHLVNAFGYDY